MKTTISDSSEYIDETNPSLDHICTICNEPKKEGNVCRDCRNKFRPLVCIDDDYILARPYSECLKCIDCDLHGFPCARCSIYFDGRLGFGYSTNPIPTEFMLNVLRKVQTEKEKAEQIDPKLSIDPEKLNSALGSDQNDGFYECRYCRSKQTIFLTFQSRMADESEVICISCQSCDTNYVHSERVSPNALQMIRSIWAGEVLYEEETETNNLGTDLPESSNYVTFESTLDHVYAIPDCYVGSIDKTERTSWVMIGGHYEIKTVEVPEAMYNIFRDVVSSARDQVSLLKENRTLDITVDRQSVKVKFKSGIPIAQNKDGIWYPDLIFGHFNAVDSDGNRLSYVYANVFSKKFTVRIADKENNLGYRQTWEHNMTIHHPPTLIEYYNCDESFTEIEYVLDFERFEYSEYPVEALQMFGAYLSDISMTRRFNVGYTINYGENNKESTTWKKLNIKKYSILYNIEIKYEPIHLSVTGE